MSLFHVVPVSSADYRRAARRRLPRFLFDYIDGGANDEHTLRDNVDSFARLRLRQRVMRNVDNISTDTQLLGLPASLPLALAPVGMAGMMARRGETQGARAAQQVGVPFTTSTVGICSIEEVRAATGAPFCFQLYMLRDRELVQSLLERAHNAGCTTLVFTVDLAVPGLRLRDFRNGMLGGGLPGKLSQLAQLASSPLWAYDVGVRGKPHNFGNLSHVVADADNLDAYKAFIDAQFDPTVTWDDIAWLRQQWSGRLIIKGVLEVDDAQAAIDAGADGVVVSNHGGRQLDTVAPGLEKLQAVRAALGDKAEILLDGGIRNGLDVLKAVALGADGVLIGRPWVWAVAARGERGIVNLLHLFEQEIRAGMALLGVNRLDEVNVDVIERN